MIIMKKIFLLALLLTSSFSSFAETKHALGAGYQYGGALGYKFSAVNDANIFFISAGLIGGATGYQRIIDEAEKHTIGMTLGSEALTSEKGFALMTYNYFPSGASNSGWTLGISAGVRREDKGGSYAALSETDTFFAGGIHFGYQF